MFAEKNDNVSKIGVAEWHINFFYRLRFIIIRQGSHPFDVGV